MLNLMGEPLTNYCYIREQKAIFKYWQVTLTVKVVGCFKDGLKSFILKKLKNTYRAFKAGIGPKRNIHQLIKTFNSCREICRTWFIRRASQGQIKLNLSLLLNNSSIFKNIAQNLTAIFSMVKTISLFTQPGSSLKLNPTRTEVRP